MQFDKEANDAFVTLTGLKKNFAPIPSLLL